MKIFIYGTLKKNCSNYDFLKKFIKYGTKKVNVKTLEKYPMFQLNEYFPYLENKPGIGKEIIGELYEIDEKKIYILDHFEGVPDLYKQGKINVIDENLNIYKDVLVYFKAKNIENYKDIELISEWIE